MLEFALLSHHVGVQNFDFNPKYFLKVILADKHLTGGSIAEKRTESLHSILTSYNKGSGFRILSQDLSG